jgi:hypothetical protein
MAETDVTKELERPLTEQRPLILLCLPHIASDLLFQGWDRAADSRNSCSMVSISMKSRLG